MQEHAFHIPYILYLYKKNKSGTIVLFEELIPHCVYMWVPGISLSCACSSDNFVSKKSDVWHIKTDVRHKDIIQIPTNVMRYLHRTIDKDNEVALGFSMAFTSCSCK